MVVWLYRWRVVGLCFYPFLFILDQTLYPLTENPKMQNKNESNQNLSNKKKNSIKKGKNVSAPVPTTVSTLAIEEKSIGTGGGRKPDWCWWQRHSRTLSLYPSQSFWVLKARNKKQIKPKPSQQENSIERNISYPVLMGHRFFPVVWFCLFLCFFLRVSSLIASLYFYLRVHRISLMATYELCLSLSCNFLNPFVCISTALFSSFLSVWQARPFF